MKRLLAIIIGCFFCCCSYAQEKLNKFFIVDSDKKTAVPSATITIVRAKLSITTEADGIFIIPGDLSGCVIQLSFTLKTINNSNSH